MTSNKLSGSEAAITVEPLKYGGDFSHSVIVQITNTVLYQKKTPKQWRENIIITIHKNASGRVKVFR